MSNQLQKVLKAQSNQLQDQARASLDSLMHCQSIQEFDTSWTRFVNIWRDQNDCAAFYRYVLDTWYEKRDKWCKAWRQICFSLFISVITYILQCTFRSS